MTATVGLAYQAGNWNVHFRDNMLASGVGVLTSGAGRHIATTGTNAVAERTGNVGTVPATQTAISTTFVDLLTPGPAVTVASGPKALISFGADIQNSQAGQGGRVGVAVSGATTIAASDTTSVLAESGNVNDRFQFSLVTAIDVNTGNNTFTLKYRLVGLGGAIFGNRWLAVVPL
jgi:hypothetical protein